MKNVTSFLKGLWEKISSFFKKIFRPVSSFLNKYVWHYLRYVFVPIGKFFSWLFHFKGAKAVASSIICVIIGILAGFIVMLFRDPANAFAGLGAIFTAGFKGIGDGELDAIGHILGTLPPMILAGISISFAFKLGLFNIGITGQLTCGAFISLIISYLGMPWYVCLLAGMVGGMLIGSISGLLKAKFNVNEVLSGIMLNWIVYYTCGLVGDYLPTEWIDRTNTTQLKKMSLNGRLPTLFEQFDAEGNLNTMYYYVTAGIFIAIAVAIIVWFVLKYTKFGFELKLCGSNKFAAKYAGINQNSKIILSLAISGAIAGICGYMVFASPSPSAFTYGALDGVMLSDGFNGISVALIGQTDPIGCIFSSFFLSYINESQTQIVNVSIKFSKYYMELIKAVIIYVASFSAFINTLITRTNIKNKERIDNSFKELYRPNKKEETL